MDVLGKSTACLKTFFASHLARAVSIIGIAAFMALLTKVVIKLKGGKGGQSGASSGAFG